MKYRLIKGALSKIDLAYFNCGAARFGLSATDDVLEVDYSEGENNGLCIRYVVFVGGSFTPKNYVRDVGEFYKICTHTKLYTVSKKDVDIIERAPL